jgi:membrane protein required for colicin V production
MNIIDFIIAGILIFALVKGFIKGLIIEVASILALILGIWGAIRFSGYVGQRLTDYFDLTTQYLGVIAFAITFIIIVLLVHLLAKILDKLLKAVALGIPIRILGAIFGVLKAILILSIVMVIINTLNDKREFISKQHLQNSVLYYSISDIAPALFPLIEGGDLVRSFEKFKKTPEEPEEPEKPEDTGEQRAPRDLMI